MADEVLLFVTYKPKEKALDELKELFSSRTTKPLDLESPQGCCGSISS